MSGRVTPYQCPYCGEGDLRPHVTADGDSPHGSWECRSCLRAFAVRFLGQLRPPADVVRPDLAAEEIGVSS